jgi:hypothetical protein
MRDRLFAAATAAALLAAVSLPAGARPHPTPTPSPTAVPSADPTITNVARHQFVAWQAGEINKSLYAPQVLAQLTDAKIAQTSQVLAALGALTDVVYMGRWINPDFPAGASGYIYQMRCTQGNVYLWLALDAEGKIATIFFKNRLDVETVTPGPSASPTPPEKAL